MDRTPPLDGFALGLGGDARDKMWIAVAHLVQTEVDSFENDALSSAVRWPSGIVAGTPISPQIAAAPDTLVLAVADPRHARNLAIVENGSLKKITSDRTKYPFLVLPHGGPEANDTLDLDSFSRMIAGVGYVVLQPEYRGSTGYGSDFLEAIYQHFGDRAYEDVDSATDYAIAQGWADPHSWRFSAGAPADS